MAKSLAPYTDVDRVTIVKQLPEAVKATPSVPSMVTSMIAEEFVPAAASFEQTFELRAQAIANDKAMKVKGKALDERFDVSFRLFGPTVRDERGVGASGELAKMAGGHLPSEVIRLPLNEEHLYTAEILRQVPLRTDLTYDEDRYAELAVVHAELPAMVASLAATALAVKTATDNHKASRAHFDAVYGRLRRIVRAAGGEALVRALLPEFITRDPKRDDNPGEAHEDDISDAGAAESSAQRADLDDVG